LSDLASKLNGLLTGRHNLRFAYVANLTQLDCGILVKAPYSYCQPGGFLPKTVSVFRILLLASILTFLLVIVVSSAFNPSLRAAHAIAIQEPNASETLTPSLSAGQPATGPATQQAPRKPPTPTLIGSPGTRIPLVRPFGVESEDTAPPSPTVTPTWTKTFNFTQTQQWWKFLLRSASDQRAIYQWDINPIGFIPGGYNNLIQIVTDPFPDSTGNQTQITHLEMTVSAAFPTGVGAYIQVGETPDSTPLSQDASGLTQV
jgi:hypothetical protein